MTSFRAFLTGAATFAVLATPLAAHGNNMGEKLYLAQTVVPQAEKDRAQELMADGPTETTGIAGVQNLGAMPLDGEFTSSDGLTLRVRELVIDPGGIVAVHQHDNRPGVAYIIEGEMTEHRSTEAEPSVKSAGSTAFERSGVVHWWENTGGVPARALVVDIVKAQEAKN